MELLTEREHQLLAYAAAVQRQGAPLTLLQFVAFADSPKRKRGRTQLRATRAIADRLTAAISAVPADVIEEPETTLDYFVRVGWVETDARDERWQESVITVTDLGSAVLRHVEAETTPNVADLTIVLDPKDPFSYARVIGRIADLGEALLVDPYFGLEQLSHVAIRTSVTRVLTSDAKRSDLAGLGAALDTTDFGRPFSIRVADRHEVHDRYVIADTGRVHFIGTSLSGVGKKPSAMGEIHGGPAVAISKLYNDIWDRSGEIELQVGVAERTQTP